jgi:hypothetical protein
MRIIENRQKVRAPKTLMEKWMAAPKALSVAGIANPDVREATARVLENAHRDFLGHRMNEATFSTGVTGPTGLTNGIPQSGDGKGLYAGISMALNRRVTPQLFANVLVGMQPMNGPIGLAFAMRRLYKTNDPTQVIEAVWKHVPEFSGFTGNFAGEGGPDKRYAGTAVETEAAEKWAIGGDADRFERTPELTIMLSRQAIVAKTRKLAASYSIEAAEDIQRVQKINMMNEIVKSIQEEVTAEIDAETIQHCKNLCQTHVYKRAKATEANPSGTNGLIGWEGTWSQQRISNVILKIKAAANSLATANRRAAANIAVVSPDIATLLESAHASFNRIESKVGGPTATPEIGTLNGTIRVFRDANCVIPETGADTGEVLLAYKGEGINDCGVVYCPYTLNVINTGIDPNTFAPRVGVMSRYAFADNLLGAENYYRHLRFEGVGEALGGESW